MEHGQKIVGNHWSRTTSGDSVRHEKLTEAKSTEASPRCLLEGRCWKADEIGKYASQPHSEAFWWIEGHGNQKKNFLCTQRDVGNWSYLGHFPSQWDTGMLKVGFNSSDSENRTTLNVLLVIRKREKKRNKDNQPSKLVMPQIYNKKANSQLSLKLWRK